MHAVLKQLKLINLHRIVRACILYYYFYVCCNSKGRHLPNGVYYNLKLPGTLFHTSTQPQKRLLSFQQQNADGAL